MNKEILSIIRNMKNVLHGQPWYGRAVYEILEEVKEADSFKKPGNKDHSMIELLYHMITWAEFCLKHLENAAPDQVKEVESRDWRVINPGKHNWKSGVLELKGIHERIETILETKQDDFLSGMVTGREFNYRFMINGLIQHNIYHLGQVAYIKKSISS